MSSTGGRCARAQNMDARQGFVRAAALGCLLLIGCETGSTESPQPAPHAGDPCGPLHAEPVACIDDAGSQLRDASPYESPDASDEDSGAEEHHAPAHDAAVDARGPEQVGACDKVPDTLAFDLCLWADEADLARLYDAPNEDIEIAASVSLAGRRYEGAELELHGATSLRFPKKSLRIRFPENRPRFDFFGEGNEELERLVLLASWIDPSFVRIKLVFDTLREMGGLAPRVGYARVYLNGKLEGLFVATERVDEHFLRRNGLSRRGNLYKADTHSANWEVRDEALEGFSNLSEEGGNGDDLEDLFRAVQDTPSAYEDFEREIASRVDMVDFDLWHIVMSHMNNIDTFSKNYYLYRDPYATEPAAGSVFRIIHWDVDATLGIHWGGMRHDGSDRKIYGERNALARAMYAIPTYRGAYLRSFSDHLKTTLAASSLRERATVLLEQLEQDIRMDHEYWMRETSFEDEQSFLFEILDLREQIMTDVVQDEIARMAETAETEGI